MEKAIVLLLIIFSKTNAGVYFWNNDTTVREDSTREEIIVGINSSTGSFDATVYILTVNEYIDEVGTNRLLCNSVSVPLPTSYDSVEVSDFATRMYTLLFNNTHQQSFNLEIVDDDLSEREETFIIYINSTELDESENCAKLFTIQDNDAVVFNLSAASITIEEGDGNHLSILKMGENEPNISLEITINNGSATEGIDFVLPQKVFLFQTETYVKNIVIEILEDNLSENTELFTISLPAMDLDVMLIQFSTPNEATVYIVPDDDVAVQIMVGFLSNSTSVVLREGGEKEHVCIGVTFGHLDENMTIYLQILAENVLQLEVSSMSLNLTSSGAQCLTISPQDNDMRHDTLLISTTVLTLNVLPSDVQVQLNPINSTITLLDDDVITYISEPHDVNIVLGEAAYFPCTYTGTNSTPQWKIEYPNGRVMIVSSTALPPRHFYNDTGLIVTTGVANCEINLTTYSCFFRLRISSDVFDITSSRGTLRIDNTIKFSLITLKTSSLINITEGESTNHLLQITKEGLTNITFHVFLDVEPLKNIDIMEVNAAIPQSPRTFYPSTSSVDVPIQVMEDLIPESLKTFRLTIDKQIYSIGNADDDTSVYTEVVGSPVDINIIDNDYVVGFDSNFKRLTEGSSVNVCISILQPPDLSLVDDVFLSILQIQDNETSEFNNLLDIPSRIHLLHSQVHESCATITSMRDHACNTWPAVILQVKMINETSTFSVKLMPQFVTIIVDDKDCKDIHNNNDIIIIIVSLSITTILCSVTVALIMSFTHFFRFKRKTSSSSSYDLKEP